MSEYYMMDCWGLDNDEPYQRPVSNNTYEEEMSWFLGQVSPIDIRQPIEMVWSEELSGGGAFWDMFGSPTEGPRNTEGVRRLWAYPTLTPPLYHREIYEGLVASGATNLDAYETKITERNGSGVCTDYLALNIIGLVKAANLEKSKATPHNSDALIDTDFDSVVLDEEAIPDLKVFRLAESVNAVVVHRSTKEHLESLGGFELTFTEPENWVG